MNALLIGIFSGIAATILNLLYNLLRDRKEDKLRKEKEKREYKMRILSEVIGYRGQISTNSSHGKNLEVAINQVFLAFQDNEIVISKFMTFKENVHLHNDRVVDSLTSLFKAMCDDLGVKYSYANDNLFTEPLSLGTEQPPFIIQLSNQQGAINNETSIQPQS